MSLWLAAGLGAAATLLLGFRWGTVRAARRSAAEVATAQAEVTRRLDEIFTLQELSFVLSESIQAGRIAERITGYLSRFLKIDGSLVVLTTNGGQALRVAAAAGTLASLAGTEFAEDDAGRIVQAMGREQLELVERGDHRSPVLLADTTVDRAAILPLRAHGVTVGALAVSTPSDVPFSSEDLRLLSTVATHAAVALSNARFFDLVRAGRDQWETTFNAIAEGIAVVDERNRIRRSNRALANLVSASIPSLSGVSFPETLFAGSADIGKLIENARQGTPGGPLVQRSAAVDRTLRVSAAPMRGQETAPWAVVLVEDVTEEQALESQLIQNEKMAAVGQLVSGVAHELNNPLTSIAGLAEFLLEQESASEREREHLRVIHEQADRAGRIVRNLLTFARKGPATAGQVDLNDIVQRTLSLVGYELRLREVLVEPQLDVHLPLLHGDRYELQQVVLNLLTNAAHAVEANPPDRPRRVAIATARETRYALLRVTDSGPGMTDEVASQIFTPFYTTKAPGTGTGLGLSIAFQIVQRHGGTLVARRARDAGAVFEMRLPIADAADVPAEETPAAAAPEPVDPSHPATALLLDDDPAVRKMISVILASKSVTVDAAQGAADAVGKLEQQDYDLIIADPRAAVSAGERFGDCLARRWPERRARTILLTADVRPETQAWLEKLGCRFFVKPFRVGDLKHAAAELLGGGEKEAG